MRIRTAGVAAAFAGPLLASALLVSALLVSACGNGKSTGDTAASPKAKSGTLVIWADDKRTAALKPFAEKFGQETGVKVDVQAISAAVRLSSAQMTRVP